MASTFAEKILAEKAGRDACRAGDYVWVSPDLAVGHDLNYPKYRRMMREMGYPDIARPETFFVTIDHTTHSEDPGKLADHRFIRTDARAQKVGWFLDVGRGGISHNAPLDLALVKPGMLVMASDTRAPALGCQGAFSVAIGLGLATVMSTGRTWLRVPESIRVELTGTPRPGLMSRDVAQWVANRIGAELGDYRCVEFSGPVVEAYGEDARHTLCNATVDIGVKTAVCLPALASRPDLLPDEGARYAETFALDVSGLEPQVSLPPDPENVTAISAVKGRAISSAFIGSCIGGKMEDMRAAAAVLQGRQVHPDVRLTVIPATRAIYQKCLEEGLVASFNEAGADVAVGVCGPCYGTYAPLNDGDVSICTATRNDPGRMGSEAAHIYIANSAVVAASSVAGRIADPADLAAVVP